MPIIELSENVGYIPGAVNIGVVRLDENTCAVIDTGLNDTAAKKALKAISMDWNASVTHILTTHAHADHFGGNATVVKRTGAKVWAPALDEAILKYPVLLPSLLFAGADPPPSLRGRFLLANPSPVDHLYPETGFKLGNRDFGVINLAGHSPGQIGLVVEDIFFCADVVLPESVLTKYGIPYLYSVSDHQSALETARSVRNEVAVPGHGDPTSNLHCLVDMNVELMNRVESALMSLLMEPRTAGELYQRLADEFEAPIVDPVSFFLLQPTVYGFLSWLESTGRVEDLVIDHGLKWIATSNNN